MWFFKRILSNQTEKYAVLYVHRRSNGMEHEETGRPNRKCDNDESANILKSTE